MPERGDLSAAFQGTRSSPTKSTLPSVAGRRAWVADEGGASIFFESTQRDDRVGQVDPADRSGLADRVDHGRAIPHVGCIAFGRSLANASAKCVVLALAPFDEAAQIVLGWM
jgi:hypothetical protein